MYHACTYLINRKAEALKYVVDMRESKIPRAIAWPAANGRVWKRYKVKECTTHVRKCVFEVYWLTILKTFFNRFISRSHFSATYQVLALPLIQVRSAKSNSRNCLILPHPFCQWLNKQKLKFLGVSFIDSNLLALLFTS